MRSAILLGILVAADRLLKLLAETFLADGGTRVIIPGVLGATLLKGGNSGAAFGWFSGMTGVLTVFSLVCVLVLLYVLLFRRTTTKLGYAALILLAAGAMGNLYDRFVYGSVTDYLEFLFMRFPIFNLADVMVDVGALLMVICVLRMPEDGRFLEPLKKAEAPEGEEDGTSEI